MEKKETKTGVIKLILSAGKRVLLHLCHAKGTPPYYAITSRRRAKDLNIGDTIEYEPWGTYFGLFISKKDARIEIRSERSVLIRKQPCAAQSAR